MSQSLRFIAVALTGWVAVRALALGVIPGAEAFQFDHGSGMAPGPAPALPALAQTRLAAPEPVAAFADPPAYYPAVPQFIPTAFSYLPPPAAARSHAVFVRPAAQLPPSALALGEDYGAATDWSLERAAARYSAPPPPLDRWPVATIASGTAPATIPGQSAAQVRPALDRLSLSSWAMVRRDPAGQALAANGMLGGSQAGARLLWRFDRRLALSLRTSAPIGGTVRAGEIAAGVRVQPLPRVPVALTIERRQSFGRDAGRSAFALFAEGGVYDRPVAAGFTLDAYLQGGAVGLRDRQLFVDGSATLMRPLWRQFSGGVGVWGGAQPGVARLDAGPRLTWRVGRSLRAHVDYRQRLAGSAAPGSGPVLTLAGDF